MHLRMRLMKLQSKFCQKSSQQTSKKPWESCDWKKVSWAYRRGTWGQKKKQKTSEAPSEQKESGSGGANEYLLLGIEGPSISALGVYYQRKAKPGSQRNWGTWALAKATSQIFAPWIEILLHHIYNHAQKHDWKSCSRYPNALWPMELL